MTSPPFDPAAEWRQVLACTLAESEVRTEWNTDAHHTELTLLAVHHCTDLLPTVRRGEIRYQQTADVARHAVTALLDDLLDKAPTVLLNLLLGTETLPMAVRECSTIICRPATDRGRLHALATITGQSLAARDRLISALSEMLTYDGNDPMREISSRSAHKHPA
ncbi:MAG TPA: hypothetical protein VHX38_39120 [Pseudonocardiaceae bacterium]|jgi:hypothetical protein|nr:hypothetical protein [Pseudonocardiaceae bacterium]